MHRTAEQLKSRQIPLETSPGVGQALHPDAARITVWEAEIERLTRDLEQQTLLTAQAREEADVYRREAALDHAKLEALATRDGLTNLMNRRAFEDHLAGEFQRAIQCGAALSVIMLDVDRFKQYNDMFGHLAGDKVLKKVADILTDNVRAGDFAARYGGEEFAIIMPGDKAAAIEAAERLRTAIQRAKWPKRDVTASFGVATMTEQMAAHAVCDLVAEADYALYYSKSRCRNRVSHVQDVSAIQSVEDQFIAINAGGGDIDRTVFKADNHASGGQVYGYEETPFKRDIIIKTEGVARPAPEEIYSSERFGDFSYTFQNLTSGSCFLIRLHFVELKWEKAGDRVFNIIINDVPAARNFDILAECGMRNQVVVREFIAIAGETGRITLEFASVVNRAKLCAIEMIPVRFNNAFSINCGGGACSPFVRDIHFQGGIHGHPGSGDRHMTFDLGDVPGIVPQEVYQYDRYGEVVYTIPDLPADGTCLVRLHFAEAFWKVPGERVFDVTINGVKVLANFDILAEAGARLKGITRSFAATADSEGVIVIEFISVVDKAQINAIEIFWRE